MMIDIELVEEPISVLREYGRIPISFEVRSVFDVRLQDDGLRGFLLSERRLKSPWIKDYDAIAEEGPTRWDRQWDISNWVVISAYLNGKRVGGCVIAYDTPGVEMLEGRADIVVIWDLRIRPRYRGKGIGGRLVEAAVAWAKSRRCQRVKIETQNVNVPACHLYVKHGFVLCSIDRYAYPELPDEVELVWCKELQTRRTKRPAADD